MDYMTVREAGEKWGLEVRTVMRYCAEGRIGGVAKRDDMWLIPRDASRPEDQERAQPSASAPEVSEVCKGLMDLHEQRKHQGAWPFPSLYENKDLFVSIVKHFPYPMHICAPDGTLLLANEAFLEFASISNPERLYQQHNIILNPALERWGVGEFVLRAYQGEVVHAYDVRVPHQEIVDQLADSKQLVIGSTFQNMTAFPICDENDELCYIVTVFTTSRKYLDKEEIMRGREYIETHWKEEFDLDRLAGFVHMSRYHYTRLFKKYTGMTPHRYYQQIKIEKTKEKLSDMNLSIAQAFAECGEDHAGHFARVFRREVGMTASQYRRMMARE